MAGVPPAGQGQVVAKRAEGAARWPGLSAIPLAHVAEVLAVEVCRDLAINAGPLGLGGMVYQDWMPSTSWAV